MLGFLRDLQYVTKFCTWRKAGLGKIEENKIGPTIFIF